MSSRRGSAADSASAPRKRVCKACDRCRLKKSKCDGASPCSRCKVDNAICVFGQRKKSIDRAYPKGYVEMLEQQQAQLVAGLRELYRCLHSGDGWPGAPLTPFDKKGHPLTHDILARLDLLHRASLARHIGLEYGADSPDNSDLQEAADADAEDDDDDDNNNDNDNIEDNSSTSAAGSLDSMPFEDDPIRMQAMLRQGGAGPVRRQGRRVQSQTEKESQKGMKRKRKDVSQSNTRPAATDRSSPFDFSPPRPGDVNTERARSSQPLRRIASPRVQLSQTEQQYLPNEDDSLTIPLLDLSPHATSSNGLHTPVTPSLQSPFLSHTDSALKPTASQLDIAAVETLGSPLMTASATSSLDSDAIRFHQPWDVMSALPLSAIGSFLDPSPSSSLAVYSPVSGQPVPTGLIDWAEPIDVEFSSFIRT